MIFNKKLVGDFIIIAIGSSILACGLFNIHAQSSISEGGVLGATLLLKNWFNFNPAITALVLDSTCYLIGFKLLGKRFLIYSLYASMMFSFSYSLYEYIGVIQCLQFDSLLITSIVGALFVGIGVGIVVRLGSACGGDDALALVIQHLIHCKISFVYFFIDIVVLLLSLSYIPFNQIVYSIITVMISSFVIQLIQTYKFKH